MDFITIDFETATKDRNSPCELGLAFVKDFKIVDKKSWLIKPIHNKFDNFNIGIHGIHPSDVEAKPSFDKIWPEVQALIEGQFLIAHNASFDFSVMRKTLELYDLPFPTLEYACSYIFSKKIWPELPAYKLNVLCSYNNIVFKHHRALSDSVATAELVIKGFKEKNINSKESLVDKLKVNIGSLFNGGYKPSTTQKEKQRYSKKIKNEIVGDITQNNPDSIFFDKCVVFTGTMFSMSQGDAKQIIADIGGKNGKGVTKKTDFLVVGQQDYKVVGEKGISSKQTKAFKYKEEGCPIEVLDESQFLENI